MDINNFINKVTGNCDSIISLLKNNSFEEMVKFSSSVLSLSEDELSKKIVYGKYYSYNLKEMIKNTI